MKRTQGIPRRTGQDGGPANRLAEEREKMKARMALEARRRRLGTSRHLDDGDADPPEEVEGVAGLNEAIAGIGKKRKGNRLSGEELEKWKAARARVKEIQLRQADAGYYCVLVFDTRGQCQAFIDHLTRNFIVGREGDLFLDGRYVAEGLGIPLPSPEYTMTTKVALAAGEMQKMPKVPKGGRGK